MTGKIFLVTGTVILISILYALPVWFLWNLLIPDIFGLSVISIWQALGLSFLSGLLFKSKPM